MAFVDIAIIGGVTSVTVPGAAAGIGAGAAAAGGLGALGTGLTMGQIGSGLSAASSALNLGSKLFGSGAQGQGQAGRAALNMGGAGEPGNVKPFVIDPRATTAAMSVPNPFGGSTPSMGGQQGPQDFYSQEQDQQGGQQVQHFDDGGGVWGDPLGDVAYDKDYNLIYDRSSTATTPTNYETLYTQPDKESSWLDWFKKTNPRTGETSYDWGKIGLLGLGGMGIASLFSKPSLLPKYQPQTGAQVGLGARLASNYAPQRKFADGGSVVPSSGVAPADLLQKPTDNQGVTMADLQNMASQYGYQLPTRTMADGGIAALSPNPTFPMSQQQTSRYAVPSQMPVSATDVRMAHLGPVAMASGGALGGYSDGGRMLKGPGDGMSDDIPATISGKQPARLADGEFVVPADVVSHLGNGSTDAGAKQLYKMMDKVRTARTGRKAQGKQIKPSKYIPT